MAQLKLRSRICPLALANIDAWHRAASKHQYSAPYAKAASIASCARCAQRPTDEWEWEPAIGGQAPRVTVAMWRKSPQFFGLRRQHAVDVVTDTDIWQAFAQQCKSHTDPSGCSCKLSVLPLHLCPSP